MMPASRGVWPNRIGFDTYLGDGYRGCMNPRNVQNKKKVSYFFISVFTLIS